MTTPKRQKLKELWKKNARVVHGPKFIEVTQVFPLDYVEPWEVRELPRLKKKGRKK